MRFDGCGSQATWRISLAVMMATFGLGSDRVAAQLSAETVQLWNEWVPGFNSPRTSNDGFGQQLAQGDFDLDGFQDLVVGECWADVSGAIDAGAFHVLRGSANGLVASPQFWTQGFAFSPESPEADDFFGCALAVGDFNGDGPSDLAIGAPQEDVSGDTNAGTVLVLYGVQGVGLQIANVQRFHQDVSGFSGETEPHDRLGSALAAGNFNGDLFWDLAIGVPGEDDGAGAVQVLYGSATGLTTSGMRWLDQDSASAFASWVNMAGSSFASEFFGSSLAAGGFNNDFIEDLAIGIPRENSGRGGVAIVFGFAGTGLDPWGNQLWSPSQLSSGGGSGTTVSYGFSLAAGDFNRDGRDDLAVGVPLIDIDNGSGTISVDAGGVHVLLGGTASGLTATGQQFWTQNSPNVPDQTEPFDRFGWALAAADLDGDGARDLAITAPFDSVGSVAGAGSTIALFGGTAGLTGSGSRLWTLAQRPFFLQGITADVDDNLGWSVVGGDFNGDSREDLAIGAPKDLANGVRVGSVAVVNHVERGGGIIVLP